MQNSFIPKSFQVPLYLEAKPFYLKVLEESLFEIDYEAVMSSCKRLKSIFGPNSSWPKDDMSLEDNHASLKVHHSEFKLREAFAYSVFSAEEGRCLGSVYIDPTQSINYDCEVYLWIREDSTALDEALYITVLQWLKAYWPFTNIAFPGRCISWEEWEKEITNSQ